MLEYPPPPCPVDDTPYTACCTESYTVDAAGRIHPGKGGVIVIKQLPMRDALLASESAAPGPTVALPATHVEPSASTTPPRRVRRAR